MRTSAEKKLSSGMELDDVHWLAVTDIGISKLQGLVKPESKSDFLECKREKCI